MSEEIQHPPKTAGDAIVDGAVAGLTGLILSAILSAVIVFGLYENWAPLKFVEHNGIDISFRLLSAEPRKAEDRSKGAGPAFEFVDIDLPACTKFAPPGAGAEAYCETHNPITPNYLTAFVNAPASASLKVVLIDSELDLSRIDDRTFVEHLIDSTQPLPPPASSTPPASVPWYVIPLHVRVLNSQTEGSPAGKTVYRLADSQWFDPAWLKLHPLLTSHVRYAVFEATTDAEVGDGKIRNFPRVVPVSTGDRIITVPTAPYIAAELYRDTLEPGISARLDCLYYGGNCPEHETPATLNAAAPLASDPARQIIFSMPTLSQPTGHRTRADEAAAEKERARRFEGVYRRIPASQLIDGPNIRYSFFGDPQPKNLIAVLGTSLPSAFDTHLTPLGTMAGSEVLVNATRTQFEFPSIERADSGADDPRGKEYLALFQEKMTRILVPAAILTAAYILLNLFAWRARHSWPLWKRSSALRAALSILFIGTVLAGCMVLEFGETLTRLFESAGNGRVIDTLTPIAGMGIEFYTDVAKFFLMMIEASLLGAWEFVADRAMHLFRKERT